MVRKLKGVVLKIASLCNLNCNYCYVYNLGDDTFKFQPKVMNLSTIDSIANEIKSHLEKLNVEEFEIVLHGGEPLLVKKELIVYIVTTINKIVNNDTKINYSLQTNGTLIDNEWCELFKSLNIGVSVSIDGPEDIHNIHRRYHNNHGSYKDVIRGMLVMDDYNITYGTLFVINLKLSATEAYNFLKLNKFTYTDFLFPDANHDNLPPVINNKYEHQPNHTPYADWWIELFNLWYFDEQKDKPIIRFLEQIVLLIIGFDSGLETIGSKKNEYLIIDTNGSIEPSDFLKLCGNGFTKRGFNINENTIEEAQNDWLINLNIESHSDLNEKCIKCVISDVCGGGHIAHRYNSKNLFDNPSIYCYDLLKLITHIQNVVFDDIDEEVRKEECLRKVTYAEALTHFKNL